MRGAFYLPQKYWCALFFICGRFGVLVIRKIPSLMLIFSFYIAICSQEIRIILYQREKRYLLKEKHLKKHQIDNTLKLNCWHTNNSSVANMRLFQNGNHIIYIIFLYRRKEKKASCSDFLIKGFDVWIKNKCARDR